MMDFLCVFIKETYFNELESYNSTKVYIVSTNNLPNWHLKTISLFV